MTAFVLLSLTAHRPTQPISKSALSHSLFVLQSSVCLYGLAFALSHSLFVLQSFVYLYGFAFALSPSLFVGERACPSRCTKPFHSHSHLKRTSIPRFTPHSPKRTQKSAIRVNSGFFIFNSQHSSKWCPAVKQ